MSQKPATVYSHLIKHHKLVTSSILGLLVCIFCMRSVHWYYSDDDLLEIAAQAEKSGISLNPNDYTNPSTDYEYIRLLDELNTLSENLVLFEDSDYFQDCTGLAKWESLPKPGAVIPKELYSYFNAHVDNKVHQRILEIRDSLQVEKITYEQEWNHYTRLPYCSSLADANYYLCEWLLTVPSDKFQVEFEKCLNFSCCLSSDYYIQAMIKAASIDTLLQTLCLRINDLDSSIIPLLKTARTELMHDARRCQQTEFLVWMQTYKQYDFNDMFMRLGVSVSTYDKILSSIDARKNRGQALTDIMTITQASMESYNALIKSCRTVRNKRIKNYIGDSRYNLYPRVQNYDAALYIDRTVVYLAIMEALFNKNEIPKDSVGQSIQEILDSDSKVIGYYLLEPDGNDPGWEHNPIWIHGFKQ